MKLHTSTPAAPKPPDPLAIALMGAHGTRKTSFALNFPDPGVLDLDANLDGPLAWHRKAGTKVACSFVKPLQDDDGDALDVDKEAIDLIFDGLNELIASPKVKTIIVDSGTKLSDVFVMAIMDREKRELMEPALWKPWRAKMIKLVHQGRSAGKHFLYLIHEQPVYGPKSANSFEPAQKVGVEMSLPTRLSEQFGFVFTDVWRTVEKRSGGENTYELHFTSDGEASLKNSLSLPSKMPMNWEQLLPHLKGRL